jgi:RNase P protein component
MNTSYVREYNFIHTPRCIQICFIKKERETPGNSLSGELLDYEYMGAAEYEFGQLPASAFEIAAACEPPKSKHDHWSLPTIKLQIAGMPLYVKGAFYPDQVADISKGIQEVWEDKLRLKESARFTPFYLERSKAVNNIYGPFTDMLWWDIRNNYVFTFNESAAKKVPDWLGQWYTHAKNNDFIKKIVNRNQYRRFNREYLDQVAARLAGN